MPWNTHNRNCTYRPLRYTDPSGYTNIAAAMSLSEFMLQMGASEVGGYWTCAGGGVGTIFGSLEDAAEHCYTHNVVGFDGAHFERQNPRKVENRWWNRSTGLGYLKKSDAVWYSVVTSNPPSRVNNIFAPEEPPQGQGGSVPSWIGWSNNIVTTAAYGATEAGGSMRLTKGGSLSLKYYASAWTGGSKARISTYNLSKLGTGVGYGTSALGVVTGGINFALSDKSWGDYGALGVSLLSSGLTLSGVTAPIGIGIGFIDVMGSFNGFYEGLDANQQLYNTTGGVIFPINGIPTYIQLKK